MNKKIQMLLLLFTLGCSQNMFSDMQDLWQKTKAKLPSKRVMIIAATVSSSIVALIAGYRYGYFSTLYKAIKNIIHSQPNLEKKDKASRQDDHEKSDQEQEKKMQNQPVLDTASNTPSNQEKNNEGLTETFDKTKSEHNAKKDSYEETIQIAEKDLFENMLEQQF